MIWNQSLWYGPIRPCRGQFDFHISDFAGEITKRLYSPRTACNPSRLQNLAPHDGWLAPNLCHLIRFFHSYFQCSQLALVYNYKRNMTQGGGQKKQHQMYTYHTSDNNKGKRISWQSSKWFEVAIIFHPTEGSERAINITNAGKIRRLLWALGAPYWKMHSSCRLIVAYLIRFRTKLVLLDASVQI